MPVTYIFKLFKIKKAEFLKQPVNLNKHESINNSTIFR